MVDFGVIKELVGRKIDETLDHATIVNPNDASFIEWLTANEQDFFAMPDAIPEPSAENLAHLIFNWAHSLLGSDGLEVVRVRFRETPNGWADYP